ncbi:MAG: hypothetical protein O2782_03385 [bacterium]|nr:hypothetical protein [bacterium]
MMTRRRHREVWLRPVVVLLIAIGVTGCAAGYARYMGKSLGRMQNRDWQGALAKLEKPTGDTNLLLYRLEKGLILHYAGDWVASNAQFERAERLIDRHHTRSASREIASLVTNDALRAYSGEEYERVLIHYYRALNYLRLDDPQGALVECRKANLRLADFAEDAEVQLSYKNDAFLQYLTGQLFDAAGEVGDAYVSYRDAAKGYAAYQQEFGLSPPAPMATDLKRTTDRLGFVQEWIDVQSRWGLDPGQSSVPAPGPGTVTVFAESGFVGRKGQQEISLPIMDNDRTHDIWLTSDHMVHRYHDPRVQGRVQYWLRVALPVFVPGRSAVAGVRLRVNEQSLRGWMLEDLDAIATKSLQEKQDSILLRTTARALLKWIATKKAEDKDEFLGILVNLFGAGTEAADTRSWVSLPQAIWMARAQVPAGTTELVLEFINAGGGVVDQHTFSAAEVNADHPVFLSWRSFR